MPFFPLLTPFATLALFASSTQRFPSSRHDWNDPMMGGLNAFDTLHIAGIFFLSQSTTRSKGNITAQRIYCMSALMRKSLSVWVVHTVQCVFAMCSLRFIAYMCHKTYWDWHVENKSSELINTPKGKSDYLYTMHVSVDLRSAQSVCVKWCWTRARRRVDQIDKKWFLWFVLAKELIENECYLFRCWWRKNGSAQSAIKKIAEV